MRVALSCLVALAVSATGVSAQAQVTGAAALRAQANANR
jgi:hypothetical protein